MAQSFEAVPYEDGDEVDGSLTLDNTCPECGTDSVATFRDRYSSYEYCTNCDWSDEDDSAGSSRQPIGRANRDQDDG